MSEHDLPNTDVRVLVVDDDSMVREWVRMSLDGSEFRVTGEATTYEEVLDVVSRRRPNLMLVDHQLGNGVVGVELIRDLRRQGVTTPAVVMTANANKGLNEAAREAGAQGTLLKTGKREELLAALRGALNGTAQFDPRHPMRAPGRGALSPREREVLQLVAAGSTNAEIAAKLGVGDETVKTLLARTFAKLGVRRRAEAVSEAHKRGLL